jgi:hypothetical protein
MIDRSADALVRPCDDLIGRLAAQDFMIRFDHLGGSRLSTGVEGSAFSSFSSALRAEEVSKAEIAGAVL